MSTIIVIKKVTIIKTFKFSIKEKKIIMVLPDNIKIRVIYSSIYQNYCIKNFDLILK